MGQTLWDLGAIINLKSLSMMRKLNYGEPKSTQMTLKIVDHYITYQYVVLEYVRAIVDDLLFPLDFMTLDTHEDSETPLLLERPLMTTSKILIDVELSELILRFNK